MNNQLLPLKFFLGKLKNKLKRKPFIINAKQILDTKSNTVK